MDLSNPIPCVRWIQIPSNSKSKQVQAQRQKAIFEAYHNVDLRSAEKLVIMADSANARWRGLLAKNFAKFGCSNIEAVDCPDLFASVAALDAVSGVARLEAVLKFAADCMTHVEKTPLLKVVSSHLAGKKIGTKKFGRLIPLCIEITRRNDYQPVLALLTALDRWDQTRAFRREMFYSMCVALRLMSTGQFTNLTDAAWQAQNRIRHRGRILGARNVGSTLLVKGLEFDHALITDAHNLDRKHLYVALTRSVRSLTILSPSSRFTPKPSRSY
jgi:DNA helicase-2/ATP-dependent DNA helicase PcrA